MEWGGENGNFEFSILNFELKAKRRFDAQGGEQ